MSSAEPAAAGPPSPSESVPPPITFWVKSSNDTKYNLTLAPTTTVVELKTKLAELSEISKDRQRLIYSGRVMKDEETLASYKLQSGHTVHMVKGAASNAARGGASEASGSNARPTVPTNIAAGTGNNPLAGLTGARYAGHVQLPNADMFGPDGGMGPPPGPEQLAQAMSNPQFQATMNDMLQNPQILDLIISSNPMLQQLGPEAREMMRSDHFRNMVSNPDLIRSMSQMAGSGRGMWGVPAPSFPEPGRTDTTPGNPSQPTAPGSGSPSATPTAGSPPPPNLFATPGANPFAALFGAPPPRPADTSARPGGPAAGAGQNPPTGPQAIPMDPAAVRAALMHLMGGEQSGAAGPGGIPGLLYGDGGQISPPLDTRPPEDRYAEQLRQLNDMGFYDFERNVQALRRSGGSVQGAINDLLNG